MAKSGKKNKKADGGNKKNKKGKGQETAETPTPQPELSTTEPVEEQPQPQEEQEQQPETVPLPDSVPDLTGVPATEPEPQSTPEPALEVESTPAQQEPELEQPEPLAEQVPTPSDSEKPSPSPIEDDGGFTQITTPDTPTSQDHGMNDAQEAVSHEPSQEDLGAWEQLDSAEVKDQHDDDTFAQPSSAVEAPEEIPVTAPQSPVLAPAPAQETAAETTDPWSTWEEEKQPEALPTPVNTNPFEVDFDTLPATTDPAAESTPAEPAAIEPTLTEHTPAESTPADPALTKDIPAKPASTESALTGSPEPEPEPEPASVEHTPTEPAWIEPVWTEPAPAEAAPVEPASSPKPEPERELEPEMEPAQEVTPPASKPQSPAPATASPSFKSVASPTPRAVSPASISVADTVQTMPPIPPAAPTPPMASPVAQSISPVKDAAFATPKDAPPTPPSASPVYHATYPADQAYSPRQKPISPLQKHDSPARKSSSPLPKVSSPLAHTYTSPAMSPHAMSAPPMAPPSVTHSYATAYQSPVMSTGGYFPPQYGGYYQPSPHHQHHHHPNSRGSMGLNGANTFAGLREAGYINGHELPGKGGPNSSPEHEEPSELLQRIQDAIPDINRLLGSYKNTKIKLQSREAEFKQMESQHKQALMHKDFFIEALQNQLRKTANESAEEATRLKNMINELRMELGNLEEKRKDFEERLAESEATVEKLEQSKADLEGQIKKLNEDMEAERVAHGEAMEKQRVEKEAEKEEALTTQKNELTELFEEIKAEDEKAAADALAARENELLEQQEAMKAEYEQQKQQMQESHDALQADFDTKLTELASTKEELDQKHKELGDTREAHAKELEELRQAHTEQVESLENSHQEQVAELERLWNEEKTDLETRLADKSEELANCERENKRLEEDVIVKEQQLQHAVENMRFTIDNLDKDCDRLRKTLHSLGEATDLKSTKGDSFFLDCFDQLSRLIVDLSKEHFSYLPIDPPKEVLSKLPPELPSFLDNTPASRELRSAYVQHVISKTLTYRIFHPFLFTLGRRYDKADILFQMLSMDIRRKSVRREAFWRQQTLKAAYTTSDAKESINVVAAVIVDEISNNLKHFADPKRMDSLLMGIRKIVKLAAETWRHARVERELIIASLPAPEAETVSNEDWEEYGAGKDEACSTGTKDSARHVILRPFPRIIREAAHEDFVGDEEKANPCTYSRGKVLYSDSPVVLARLQELAKKSTDALAGGEDSVRRGSRGSNYYSPPPSPRSRERLRASGEENCAAA